MKFTNFIYKKYFTHVCDLIPGENIKVINQELFLKKGITYVILIDNEIYHVGSSIGNAKDRFTNANYIIGKINEQGKVANVFGYFPKFPQYEVFDKTYNDNYTPSKVAEEELIRILGKQNIN